MKYIFLAITLSFFLLGCASKTPNHTEKLKLAKSSSNINLDSVIINIADQLLTHSTNINSNKKIILTTFVDLESFTTTNSLGRIVSESLYNELHSRVYEIIDFRGQDTVSVNADGEFHLTRDVNKLKDEITAVEKVLVGTYSRFEDESILINSRIIDSLSGFVYSTARIIYKPYDCKEYNICNKETEKMNINSYKSVKIVRDKDK